MPSPDVTAYVDLTLADRTPGDLVDRALVDAVSKLPGWVPREGNTEVVVLEADALMVAELVFAINRLPGAVTEVLARLFGLERDNGTPPTATVEFQLSDTLGHVIPAGTLLRLTVGTDVLTFATDEDLAVVAPADTGVVAVTGTDATDVANGTAAGTVLEVLTPLMYVDAAELATAVADGVNPEDGGTFLTRAVQRFARLTETLVLPRHFELAALEDPAVARALALDLYDPAVGPAPGDNPGHITVAVIGQGAALLSAPAKAALEAALEEDALANLDVHVIDPTITAVEVDVVVVRDIAYAEADVEAAILDALDLYLSPETWEWGGTVYVNEVIALVDAVPGVRRVVDVQLDGAGVDVPIAGAAPLADLDAGSTADASAAE